MGSSNNCKQIRQCQEKEINPSYLQTITINAIIESSECIPQEARTIQLYKSQKSIFSGKDIEFDKRLRQSGRQDHINNQMSSIKVLDSLNSRQPASFVEAFVLKCSWCSKDADQYMVLLECKDQFHQNCLIQLLNRQIDNNNSQLHCKCQQKIHTKILRQFISQFQIEKFFSNQLGTLQQQNQNVLCFSKHQNNHKEYCIYCEKIIISQQVQLKCNHCLHKHCVKKLCYDQIEKDKTYLICTCGASIHTSLIRSFKSDSFKPILSRLFKNQLIEMYNTSLAMQNKFSFKCFIKAVNFFEDQKLSSCSLP